MEELLKFFFTLLATLVGGWAGGCAAFRSERIAQEKSKIDARISAANKAISTLALMFNAFENLRQYAIDEEGIRNTPDRALQVQSPQPGMMSDIKFNFDELCFFLEQPGETIPQVLLDLNLLEWQYKICVQTVEHRARADEELRLAMRNRPIANNNLESIKHFYADEYGKLEAMTDQLIATVDNGISQSKCTYKKLQIALQQQFPSQSFLKIKPFED